MRHLKDGRGSFSMPNELRLALESEAYKLRLKGVRVQGETKRYPPKGGHVAAWFLARIYRMPEAERERLRCEGMAILNEMLKSDDMVKLADDWPFCGSSVDAREDTGVGGVVNPPATSTGALHKSRRGGNQDTRRDRKATCTDR